MIDYVTLEFSTQEDRNNFIRDYLVNHDKCKSSSFDYRDERLTVFAPEEGYIWASHRGYTFKSVVFHTD